MTPHLDERSFCALEIGAAHNFEWFHGDSRLRHREYVNIIHKFFHYRQLPN